MDLTNIKEEENCLNELNLQIKENDDLARFSEIFDGKFLLHFVRGRKFDSKKAYETLQNYVYVRTTRYAELFRTLSANNFASNHGVLSVLKHRDDFNRPVILCQIRIWNPLKVCVDDAFKVFVLFMEEVWNIEEVNGVVVIFDMKDWNFQHIKAVPPTQIYRAINLFVSNIPLRYAGIHFVNLNYIFSLLLRAVRPAFPTKIRERMHVHSSTLDSLHQLVSKDVLPKSLEGNIFDEDAFDKEFEDRILAKDEYYKRFNECLYGKLSKC